MPQSFALSGTMDNSIWKAAEVLRDFTSPWDDLPVAPIEFRALHDQHNLYLAYQVFDKQVHLEHHLKGKKNVDHSDRVEIFMRSDAQMDPYYCLEIDPLGRLQDFMAWPQQKFDFDWDWPKDGIDVWTTINPDFFTVEVRLSMEVLNRFGLIHGQIMEAGIFRAKYHQQPGGQHEPSWITWVDPQVPAPQFHIPSSFGQLIFQD